MAEHWTVDVCERYYHECCTRPGHGSLITVPASEIDPSALRVERDHYRLSLERCERDRAHHFARASAAYKALDRLLATAEHIFTKEPVRDWGETLAEAREVLLVDESPSEVDPKRVKA